MRFYAMTLDQVLDLSDVQYECLAEEMRDMGF